MRSAFQDVKVEHPALPQDAEIDGFVDAGMKPPQRRQRRRDKPAIGRPHGDLPQFPGKPIAGIGILRDVAEGKERLQDPPPRRLTDARTNGQFSQPQAFRGVGQRFKQCKGFDKDAGRHEG